jgi:putative sterol carrier protein
VTPDAPTPSKDGTRPNLTEMAALVAFVEGKSDAALEAECAAYGVDALLDAVFSGLGARYRPKSGAPSATIKWALTTPGGSYARCLRLGPAGCETVSESGVQPNAVLETRLPVFLQIVAERINAFTAYGRGTLRIEGDRALALKLQAWFATEGSSLPLDASTPRELSRLIDGRTNEEIAAAVGVAGVDRTLNQVFDGMVSRYLPGSGPWRRSTVEFVVQTEEGPRVRQFVADKRQPSWHEGSRESADVRVEIRLPEFLNLVSGRLDAFSALTQRKLKVRGNLLKASGIQKWFDLSS